MSKTLSDLKLMKSHLQQQMREADKAEGRKSAILEQLQNDFGLSGLRPAAVRLKELEADLDVATAELNESLDKLSEFAPDA